MAANTIRWIGGATAVAQVDTFDPGSVGEGDTFTLTVTGWDGRALSFTATAGAADDEGDIVDDLVAAWNASTDSLCTGITAAKVGSDAAATMTLTADTAGTAFSVAPTTSGGTFTRTATTANAGPYDVSTAANWSSGAVPGSVADSTVYIQDATILYGLDQSAMANALVALNVSGSRIGTTPADGCLGVYLQIKATAVNIGMHSGPGTKTESPPVMIDTGATASTITVYNSGTNSVSDAPAVWLKANANTTAVIVRKGIVGIGWGDGETTTLQTITVLYDSVKSSDAKVFIGAGVTMSNTPSLTCKGGETVLLCAPTTVNADGGTLETEGSFAITTLNIRGATVTSNSTGTVTTAVIDSGTLDTTKSAAARTFTNLQLNPGGTFKREKNVTVTNWTVPTDNVTLSAVAA